MLNNPFEEKINQLVNGEVEELVVLQADFFQFREAWLKHSNKKEIVGEAGLDGMVRYKYLHEAKNNGDS